MNRLILTLIAFLTLICLIPNVSSAQDGICRRQNLAGMWENPNPAPDDLWHVDVGYNCSRNTFTIGSTRMLSSGGGNWSTRKLAAPMGNQDPQLPTKIGASWEPAVACTAAQASLPRLKFWHVIVTWQSEGLKVLYRGRLCEGNRPFVKQYLFRRSS